MGVVVPSQPVIAESRQRDDEIESKNKQGDAIGP
jgi:hypothetical protein